MTSEDSGQQTADFIKREYSEFIVKKKNLRLEEALYDTDRLRKNGEGLVNYIARRKDRFNKLQKEGWTIPDDVKGYLLYRDAHLPEKARELIEMWTKGEYDWENMQVHMKALERLTPGPQNGNQPRTRMLGMVGFQESVNDMSGNPNPQPVYVNSEPEIDAIFMNNSFYLAPESFEEDEDLLLAALADHHEPDAIWLPDDFPEEGLIPEDIFITILANYGQVRKFLHTKALGRGFKRPTPPSSGAHKPKAILDRKPPASGGRPSYSTAASSRKQPTTHEHWCTEEVLEKKAVQENDLCEMWTEWTLGTDVHEPAR